MPPSWTQPPQKPYNPQMSSHRRPFTKMHGLGNDFVVVDARSEPFAPDVAQARAIADRRKGVGFDQLIVIEAPSPEGAAAGAEAFMRIRNADGGEVEACGNATRCVASLLFKETGRNEATIETLGGVLKCRPTGSGAVTVDMGVARTEWQEIPLAQEADTLHAGIEMDGLADPVCTNMGNPHATFFVADAEAIALDKLGPQLEHHAVFPERANIGVAQLTGENELRLRVWERGVGITRACGTGACAAAVAAARREITGRKVTVRLDGGPLEIEWREGGHVLMTGPVATAFTGELLL